jgi:hypothetical protein
MPNDWASQDIEGVKGAKERKNEKSRTWREKNKQVYKKRNDIRKQKR